MTVVLEVRVRRRNGGKDCGGEFKSGEVSTAISVTVTSLYVMCRHVGLVGELPSEEREKGEGGGEAQLKSNGLCVFSNFKAQSCN